MQSDDLSNLGPHAALNPGSRRELIRRGHALRARLIMGRQGITDAFVAQIDQAMSKCELLKVRFEGQSAREADRLADELAGKIAARVVQRVGRVALLHRPLDGGKAR